MTEERRITRRRWLLGIGVAVTLVLIYAGWSTVQGLQSIGAMTNQTYQQVKSPDGRYVATLAYRDGMTFGFGYICLQPLKDWHSLKLDDPLPKSEVVEVAAEGLQTISWKGNQTLIVTYQKSGEEAAQFVTQPQHWRDVTIVYRGVP